MQLEQQFIINQALLQTRLQRQIECQLSIHGISFTEYMIMHCLNAATENTMRRIELAESVGISASGVTRLLAPMEKNKLVEKRANPRDARVSLVKLSKVGARLYRDASVSFGDSCKQVTQSLSTKQLKSMVDLQARL